MRDRLTDIFDYDRLVDAIWDRGARLRDGAVALEDAIESGRISYISVVATR
jgi:hypothetical protein